MRWTGHVAHMRAKRNECRVFVGKIERKRPLGTLKRKWDNIIMVKVKR
jgi:hypothetical protein